MTIKTFVMTVAVAHPCSVRMYTFLQSFVCSSICPQSFVREMVLAGTLVRTHPCFSGTQPLFHMNIQTLPKVCYACCSGGFVRNPPSPPVFKTGILPFVANHLSAKWFCLVRSYLRIRFSHEPNHCSTWIFRSFQRFVMLAVFMDSWAILHARLYRAWYVTLKESHNLSELKCVQAELWDLQWQPR